jgi:uncharacterized protein (UPF0210 family)
MQIRAITAFTDIAPDSIDSILTPIAAFLSAATITFEQAGIAVQTRRLATQPFPQYCSDPAQMPALAAQLMERCRDLGINYISVGPVQSGDDPGYLQAIPQIFRAASGVFASINIGDPAHGIDLALLRRTAEIIRQVSAITEDGLTNLYLAALANVKPGSPFFPAAYHSGGPARFALAIQAADLAVSAFESADSPQDAQQRLTDLINDAAARLCTATEQIATQHEIAFAGLDFSLAPYPGESTSLAGAMERLGVTMGGSGIAGHERHRSG